MAVKYGVSPWGAWFVEALSGWDIGARLSRGKTYANTGKVSDLKVEGGLVEALVAGHSSPWYTVRITFLPLAQKQSDEICAIIQSDPMLLSRIVSGELPEELLSKLKDRHIPLIPLSWSDMKRSCTCPDWGDPCKHQAAVYYVLAREIDQNPQVLFRLRGLDLVKRFGVVAERSLQLPFTIEYSDAKREIPDTFFRLPQLENYLGFIQSLLPKQPTFSERDFAMILARFYHQAAHNAEAVFPIETDDWDSERRYAQAKWSIDMGKPKPGAPISLVFTGARGKPQAMTLLSAARLFLGCSEPEGTPEYRFLFWFFRSMRALCRASAYGPCPIVENGKLSILWRPLSKVQEVSALLHQLARLEPGLIPAGGLPKKSVSAQSAVELLSSAFLGEWVQSQSFSMSGGSRTLRNLVELFFTAGIIDVDRPAFKNLALAIDSWLAVLQLDFSTYHYRFTLHDAASDQEAHTQVVDEPVPDFTLTMDVIVDGKPVKLKDAVKKIGSIDVLRAPTALASYLPEILTLSQQPAVSLTEERLVTFLDHAAPLLGRLGVDVVLPRSLHRELKPRLVLRADTKKTGGALASYLSLETLLDYQWSISIGDQIISADEFSRLVSQKKALVKFHDTYIKLDADEVTKLLKQATATRKPQVLDVLKAQFSGDAILSIDAQALFDRLFEERPVDLPRGLNAKLRPYQERGFRWMCSLLGGGFGCVLADDMGLGKTVQAIATLLHLHENALLTQGTLVIAPAALMTNWEHEIKRFAPGLKTRRYQGHGRCFDNDSDVFLTTYQTAVRDYELLSKRDFSLLIVDEAHLLKNAHTKVSRTVKGLHAVYRLALSGTPVENRLEDMRSLFDFAIPGYLGSVESFKKEFRVPIEVEHQAECAKRLQDLTRPFLLRRLKTDTSIISDLPQKVVINEYSVLGSEQAALYESLVQNGLAASEKTNDHIVRSGIILKLLTGLKQICDHPRVYDKESPPDASLSGKCGLLLALLEETQRNREKVLVFSQYVEALSTLKTIIETELDETPLLYHGGLGQKVRDAVVERYSNEAASRILLISLKAGGVGLNLTAANRVIHFDLWYNPAVENQATDRVFRIGQSRNVFVHRFITTGTFEEKIDRMLQAKQALADLSVSSGEAWLGQMSNQELKELFAR